MAEKRSLIDRLRDAAKDSAEVAAEAAKSGAKKTVTAAEAQARRQAEAAKMKVASTADVAKEKAAEAKDATIEKAKEARIGAEAAVVDVTKKAVSGAETRVKGWEEKVSEKKAQAEAQALRKAAEAEVELAVQTDTTVEAAKDEMAEMKKHVATALPPEPQTYVIKAGDSLSKIAQEVYGDMERWPEIFEANRDQISDPNLIRPGQEIVIP